MFSNGGGKMKDAILAWVERISGKINNWAWDVRWDKRHKYSSQHE